MDLIREADRLLLLKDRPRRLLAVFAHPDDEAYGSAGALARAGNDRDTAAALLCLTRGEGSSVIGAEEGLTPGEIGEKREARLIEVAGITGIDALLVDRLPDRHLARVPLAEAAAPVRAALEALRPQVVIAHEPRGVNAHADHVAGHWAVRHALLDHPGVRFAMVSYLPEDAAAIRPRLLLATPEEEIDAVLHLTPDEAEKKERCLRVHDALVTLREDGPAGCWLRPPVERYDFLGEDFAPPLDDLFARMGAG